MYASDSASNPWRSRRKLRVHHKGSGAAYNKSGQNRDDADQYRGHILLDD
jgi:hypothetical protein